VDARVKPGHDELNDAFELAEPGPRPRTGCLYAAGETFMESIRPDNSDPIPLRQSPPGLGSIVIRFVGLLAVAVVVLALAWSR
jgi:hypothetical protein